MSHRLYIRGPSSVSLRVKFCSVGKREAATRQAPFLFQSGYFIDEPTKDALSDGLHVTVYIGFGFFLIGNRSLNELLASPFFPS